MSVCDRKGRGGGVGVGGCVESMGRNSKRRYKIKRKDTKIRNETLFRSFAKQLETFFSYFRIFFSFAKRSKLGETATCFVHFCISRNLKKYETVNPSVSQLWISANFSKNQQVSCSVSLRRVTYSANSSVKTNF